MPRRNLSDTITNVRRRQRYEHNRALDILFTAQKQDIRNEFLDRQQFEQGLKRRFPSVWLSDTSRVPKK